MNNNYVLGLDIGITSVGYGVIDIENRICRLWCTFIRRRYSGGKQKA